MAALFVLHWSLRRTPSLLYALKHVPYKLRGLLQSLPGGFAGRGRRTAAVLFFTAGWRIRRAPCVRTGEDEWVCYEVVEGRGLCVLVPTPRKQGLASDVIITITLHRPERGCVMTVDDSNEPWKVHKLTETKGSN